MKRLTFFLALFSLLLAPAIAQTEAQVSVSGEVLNSLQLTLKDLQAMAVQEVRTKDMQGAEHVYTGVPLVEILRAADVTLGKELRGENLTKSLLLGAADGYEVVYALAEVDPEFTDKVVLLAFAVDGKPLPNGEGPFRIVAPGDKRPARWIRELSSIKVLFPKE